ncbi:flagellar motor switch protein FliG [Pseudothermotoga hypogea DSM 11164 = NBRC 106472]|uniref:Flagellar motor switch protein FliG n=1 Tax=Pseudothermotoga hypogea DSM 11164 = NBRC 106472 TaxID=1123384 RepID=A0A0X1KPF1_9THEM|nr:MULTISPECIES: flagellar motor switch protein FliG [Pseudothermotoga]AJC73084.1 flagellar motor switch protein FliG [Pseudothermotoga hypogea DSM 11164 = NBRC 106472]MBC7123144.1 flagellar motor switch protein FliG [Pseudothermotoga sp.]MDI6861758.1 flagellar motor switch protein FliG [Pseudothermotoga sp.]
MPEKKQLTGKRKAAILLVMLGPEKAALVLKHLDESDVEQLTIEIANLGKITDEEKKQVLTEFQDIANARQMIAQGGIEYAKEVLQKAFGPEKAMKIIERLVSNLQVKPFDFLRQADPLQLVNFLQNEHPQTIAVILSYLEPQLAGKILSAFPEELQIEVIKRIALLERTSPDVIRDIEKNLERKLSGFVMQTFSQVGGVDTAAEIMNSIDRSSERKIMEKLSYDSPELAEEIRRRMFVFEDIVKLDDRSVQIVLREVETRDLALALKGASEEVKQKIFKNISKRAAQLLQDELEYMGPVRLKDVEEAQQKIINVIRRLEEAGEIVIARGGGEELIV